MSDTVMWETWSCGHEQYGLDLSGPPSHHQAPHHTINIWLETKAYKRHHACKHDGFPILISKSAHVYYIVQDGSTALMLAAYNGHLQVVKGLICMRANPNAENKVCTCIGVWGVKV